MEKKKINTAGKSKEEIILYGVPSSPGVSLGKVVRIKQKAIYLDFEKIDDNDIPNEIERFKEALDILISDYAKVIKKAADDSSNIRTLLESNLMMLQDEYILNSITDSIKSGNNSEQAVVEIFDAMKQNMLNTNDVFLKERSYEIDQLKHKLISTLRNQKEFITAGRGDIVVAGYVTPDEIMHLKDMKVPAVVTEVGGITSHSAILARNYEITQVVGVKHATDMVEDGDLVIVDGYAGKIIINPSADSIQFYQEKRKKEKTYKKQLGKLKNLPAETTDGKRILVKANINMLEDIDALQMVGADGVGLVRTEYLVISKGNFPTCEEQYELYKKISEQMYPAPVTFRVFDVGSDKIAEGLPRHEDNPAMGFRGIRFLLHRKDIFAEQICAILRASENKNAQLLLPMISNLIELQEAKELIEECKNKLRVQGVHFDENLPVGIMVETPSAALISCELAKHCDFISIGTNDLTQYVLATDRTNELVGYIYDSFHPAVLKLIGMTIEAAKSSGIPVSVCGELAGHSAATDLLIGMGVNELSVAPSILLELKKRIRELNYREAKSKAKKLLQYNCVKKLKKEIKA